MVSTPPLPSKFSSLFTNPETETPNYNWYKRHLHIPRFLQFPSKVKVFVLHFIFVQFFSIVSRDSKVNNFASSLFLLFIIIRYCRLAEIRWSVCMSKFHRGLCASFSKIYVGLCIYYLLVWSNLSFLHNYQWITLPTKSCVVLYPFCANLLHSLIMWLIILSLSPHKLHLLFCCVLYSLALIWSVLLALFCAAIRRDRFSLKVFLSLPRPCFPEWYVAY